MAEEGDATISDEEKQSEFINLVNDLNSLSLKIKSNEGEKNDGMHRKKQTCFNDVDRIIPQNEVIKDKDDKVLCITPLILDKECWSDIQDENRGVVYRRFACEEDLDPVIELITKDLSEPYSIYTYRYFIYNWPQMCILAWMGDMCVGAVVGKVDSPTELAASHGSRLQNRQKRGYIAMLAVKEGYRRLQIGSKLVQLVIDTMISEGCREVVLETEITNKAALALYEKLGFLRDKRLFRYYLNGVDAYRLKLWVCERSNCCH